MEQSRISILKYVTIVVGMMVVFCSVGAQIGAYYEGMAFEQSWYKAMALVPLMFFLLITFLSGFLIMIISVMLGNANAKSLIPLAIVTALFFTSYYLPIPNFVDGMHDAVNEKLERERLLELEAVVRSMVDPEQGRIRPSESEDMLRAIDEIFNEELSLSDRLPRIQVSENVVKLIYGGALTAHWGYAVVKSDTCPLDGLPSERCRKVFENVWVYYDIW